MLLLPLSAAAADLAVDVGLGLRQVLNQFDAQTFSAHGAVRVAPSGFVAAELGGAVRLPGDQVSGLTQTLVAIDYEGNPDTNFQQPVYSEVASVTLHGQVSPWRQPHQKPVGIWPYAILGVDLRFVRLGQARINPDYVAGVSGAAAALVENEPALVPHPGPAFGVGFDVWFGDRAGFRLAATERMFLQKEMDYGNELTNGEPAPLDDVVVFSGAAWIDALVRF
jgi:hypothetical protein